MELLEKLECGCYPRKAYASRASFESRFGSNRHKAWENDKWLDERTGVSVDVLTRRLRSCELEKRALAAMISELESAIFAMPARRAVGDSKKKKIAASQKWKCALCAVLLSHVFEVDHAIPLFLGGGNLEGNLQALCRECHGKKTAEDRGLFRTRAVG